MPPLLTPVLLATGSWELGVGRELGLGTVIVGEARGLRVVGEVGEVMGLRAVGLRRLGLLRGRGNLPFCLAVTIEALQ